MWSLEMESVQIVESAGTPTGRDVAAVVSLSNLAFGLASTCLKSPLLPNLG